jgi:hypothetical protein
MRLQMLVTEFDFRTPERRRNLRYTMGVMLSMGVIPIINENDAVSGNEGYTKVCVRLLMSYMTCQCAHAAGSK